MILLWPFYWPAIAVGLAVGLVAGWLAYYRRARTNRAMLIAGIAAAVAVAVAWHGPAGAGDRFASRVEQAARAELDRLELPFIAGRLRRDPLERTLVLAGPADDFQRRELPAYMVEVPGVEDARWRHSRARGYGIPLLAEAASAVLIAFALGLLLSYLLELRRRANADWRW